MNFPLLPKFFRHILAILVLNFGWLFFRYSDINQLKEVISIYLGIKNNGFSVSTVNINIQNNVFLIIASILACTPVFNIIGTRISNKADKNETVAGLYQGVKTIICFILLLFSLLAMAGNSFTPFLYNQF